MLLITQGLTGGLILTMGLGPEGGPPSGFTLIGLANSGSELTLTFTETLNLSGAASDFSAYSISGEDGLPAVLLTSLTAVGSALILGTTLQHNSGSYFLHIPVDGFNAVSGDPYTGPYDPAFTGVAANPGLLMSRMIDARTVEVIFTEPVNVYDAQRAQNYSIAGGAQVFASKQVSPIIYRLTTSRLNVDVSDTYTVTVTGVRDLENNPIS